MPFVMILSIMVVVLLGVLAFLLWRMPGIGWRPVEKKRSAAAVPPSKDWQGIADRLEGRVNRLEADAQDLQRQLRDKEKQAQEWKVSCAGMQQKLDQEKAWREKETAGSQKERQQERLLQEDLARTREALNHESTQRIRLEAELKEARRVKEELSLAGRTLSSRVLELERQLEAALKELKSLREENLKLRKKNEGTQWVAKADYIQLEAALKCVRQEVEELRVKKEI